MRSESSTDIEIEAFGFEPSIYDIVNHETVGSFSSDPVIAFGPSLVIVAELPVFDSAAPDLWSPRLFGRQNPWPGSILIYREIDGAFTLNTTIGSRAIIGQLTEDFSSGPIGVFDESSVLTVRLLNSEDNLQSRTDLQVLNGANTVAVITPSGEWEVLQFANATLNPDGTYSLSRLIRGRLGTEEYMGDPTLAGSTFVVYNPSSAFTFSGTNDLLGVEIAGRFGPPGFLPGDARYQDGSAVPRGVAYRPFAPVTLKATETGNDFELSWVRRTRFNGDGWETGDVPLNEDFERYEVEILDGSSVVRTVTINDQTNYTYTEANQITDFGSSQSNIDFNVYQVSAIFGRGTVARFRGV